MNQFLLKTEKEIMKNSEFSKEDVISIIKSNNLEVIRSLKDKNIGEALQFTEQEKKELFRHLEIPLGEVIDEPDDFHGYNFKPLYYHLFGDEYVRSLLELVGEDFEGFEYHYMWIWNLNKYSMPILRAKIKGTLSDLKFADNTEYCLIITTIGAYFGGTEVLPFLDKTDNFDIFYEMIPYEHETDQYLIQVALIKVVIAIIEHIKSKKIEEQNAATRLLNKFLELMKYCFMDKERISNVEIAYQLFRFLDKLNQLSLVSSMIKSIPQDILDIFLKNPRLDNINILLEKALRLKDTG